MSSNLGLTVLDGSRLRDFTLSLPDSLPTFTGAQVIELGNTKASDRLFDFTVPESLKRSGLDRIGVSSDHDDSFQSTELNRDEALKKLNAYIAAIADELDDNPVVISLLDGSALRIYLEDEDDFAMLAENIFTELDADENGKLKKSEIKKALDHMGVTMGVPPSSEFPLLDGILQKYGAVGEEELGQAQFAQILQLVLQEIADTLSQKHKLFVHDVKITNGSKIKKLLLSDKQFTNLVEKILHEKSDLNNGEGSIGLIQEYLEEHGTELGLPPMEVEEASDLYDLTFSSIANGKSPQESGNDEFRELVKEILEKFAGELESNPILFETGN